MTAEEIITQVRDKLGDAVVASHSEHGEATVAVMPERVLDAARALKHELGFNQFVDCTCTDLFLMREVRVSGKRFRVTYSLRAFPDGRRLRVHVPVDGDPPKTPSLCPVWRGCNWTEREVYDMFGVVFEGHPDLRRILMPEGWPANPLRKDYPQQGRGERFKIWQPGEDY